MTISKGKKVHHKVHQEFHDESGRMLVGKCAGFESSCKQLAVRPSNQQHGFVATKNPDSGKVEFQCDALPFGSSAVVHDFNKGIVGLREMPLEGVRHPMHTTSVVPRS